MLCPSHLLLFHYLLIQQMVQCEKQNNLIYLVQLIHSHSLLLADVAAALRAVKNVPKTFEGLAIELINDVPQRYNVVYFVSDTYFERSIKAAERNNRGSSDRLFVRSSKMHIPSDFQKFLNNDNNKERLFEIIEETLRTHNNTSTDRKIYFARGNTCKLLSRGYGDVTFTVNPEEADTKLICLIKHAIEHEENSEDATFIIRSTSGDIDIPVILLNAETNINVFIDSGIGNNRKLLCIHATTLTTDQKKAIVGLHAFTGFDQNSSFF